MRQKVLLCIIILVAFALRFYALGTNPPSLTWDEAAWGYNAYTLGINGHDEFGVFLPYKYLLSFGDYKPPMYAYLDVIPVKIFGLTPFATRFPSAFFGVLTVLVTYFLVKRLFYNSEKKEWYALSGAGILALSPWHIMLSRAAFEANVATFFIVSGVWLFLGGVQEKKWYLPLSAIAFSASIYTFNSARVASPLLVVLLGIIFFRQIIKHWRVALVAIVVGVLLVGPLVPYLLSPDAALRYKEVNIFSDLKPLQMSNQEIANDHNAVWSKLLHNRRVVYGLDFVSHYLDHFNPDFLFIHGDNNPKFSIQDVGEMYLWSLPFFVLGCFYLFRKREGYWWVIFLWLGIGLIPAATSLPTPHALRSEAALPTYQLITAYGLVSALLLIGTRSKNDTYRNMLYGLIGLALFANVFYYQYEYYAHYAYRFSGVWQYGYVGLMAYLAQNSNQFKTIYDDGHLGRPYIYYLFYNKTNPESYRKTVRYSKDQFGFVHVDSFGKYVFPKDMNEIPHTSNALYVVGPNEVPSGVKILKRIRDIGKTVELVVYTY